MEHEITLESQEKTWIRLMEMLQPMDKQGEHFSQTDQKWEKAHQIMARLQEAGFQAYLVGGCLRDRLLGRPVRDYDIATDALPEEVMRLFPSAVPTGLEHGTVTVIIEREPYEVTTFRKEVGYRHHRWPVVVYVDQLHTDLSRRDFTINAMALSHQGDWIDPFGGREDLENRLIRAVGEPARRFEEDALRMVRAIRFAAELGFQIEPLTWKAIRTKAHLLREISNERIQQELQRILQSPHPDNGLFMLQESGLKQHIPPLFQLGSWTMDDLAPLCRLAPLASRWAYLFLLHSQHPGVETGPELTARSSLRELRCSRKLIQEVQGAIRLVRALEEGESIHRLLLYHEDQRVKEAIWLYGAVKGVPQKGLKQEAANVDVAAAQLVIRDPRQMQIDGHDLRHVIKARPGPWIKKLLQRLYEEVALGQLPNEKQTILARARQLYDSCHF